MSNLNNLKEAVIQAMIANFKNYCVINNERQTDSKIINREKLQQAFIDLAQNNNNI